MNKTQKMRAGFLNIFLILPSLVFAQAHFENLSSTNLNSKEIYLGADNYLKIVGFGNLPKKQSLAVSHGQSTLLDNSQYIIRVTDEKPDTLKFYANGKLSLSEIFTVKRIPEAIARLGKTLDTILTQGQVLANPFISVLVPECNYDYRALVVSFTASFITSGNETVAELSQTNNLLSEDQVKEIRKLKSRDKIFFSNIRYHTADGRTALLKPFTIIIR